MLPEDQLKLLRIAFGVGYVLLAAVVITIALGWLQ